MRTLKMLGFGAVMASSLLISNVTLADGASLYTAKMCGTCHGVDAKTPIMGTYPKLAGQNTTYLIQQIKDIRDGTRANEQTAAMKGMMGGMGVSDDEVAAIAEWISSQESFVAETVPDASYSAKMCLTCHGADGKTPIMDAYPKLAGQNAEYLAQQIKDIQAGTRNNGMSASMKAMMASFAVSDDEAAAIAKSLAETPAE